MMIAFMVTVGLVVVFVLFELLRQKLEIDSEKVLAPIIVVLLGVVIYFCYKMIAAGLPRCITG